MEFILCHQEFDTVGSLVRVNSIDSFRRSKRGTICAIIDGQEWHVFGAHRLFELEQLLLPVIPANPGHRVAHLFILDGHDNLIPSRVGIDYYDVIAWRIHHTPGDDPRTEPIVASSYGLSFSAASLGETTEWRLLGLPGGRWDQCDQQFDSIEEAAAAFLSVRIEVWKDAQARRALEAEGGCDEG